MIYLLLSVLSSTAIFVLFKLFNKYKINTLQAIVINYITACSLGLSLYNTPISFSKTTSSPWFFAAIGLGFLFIAIFNVMALTAQKNGLTVASVASKMSVIIPILFGIYVYKESADIQKIAGIVLALIAVYLTSIKSKKTTATSKSMILPMILFLGSGIIDTSVNHFSPQGHMALFLSVIFGMAGIFGLILIAYSNFNKKTRFNLKVIPFGVALGLVNYASLYYLLKALRFNDFESSTVFTINNVSIVAVSTLVGLFLFKETIILKNWLGIFIAIISIILVTLK